MTESFLYDKLSLLNQVYSQPLKEKNEPLQLSSIKSKLHPHQWNMVYGMHAHREKCIRGFLSENQAIHAKIGIVADQPGTGKTLSVLTYIAAFSDIFPRMTIELSSHSNRYFFSHDLQPVSDQSTTNLIIVPHYLYHQWNQQIQAHTSMKYYGLETRRMLKGNDVVKKIIESDFVITTNKCYRYVQEFATENNIQWNNIFIDEASSIYIKSSDPPLQFQFLWFITNSWIPLIFKNPSLSKRDLYHLRDRVQLHPDLEEWLLDDEIPHYESNLVSSAYLKDYISFLHKKRHYLVLRNDNKQLMHSMQLPNYKKENYHCRPNISLQSLSSYFLSRNMPPQFNLQKIPYLLQVLNIECKSLHDYLQLPSLTNHNLIRRKVHENECMICLEQAEYPTIVNCCNNIYCGKCILMNMIMHKKCPTCREVLNISNICCLQELSTADSIVTKSKMEICLDLFQQHKNGKFIVYSSFDNIYYQLFEEIDKLGLKAERIENNLFSMLRTWKNYEEGKTNILFVSNVDLIRGISLTTTSHLIFYHEPSSYELKQVLLHSAQRIGRQDEVTLVHLNSEIQV
jgi:hypothetical protein